MLGLHAIRGCAGEALHALCERLGRLSAGEPVGGRLRQIARESSCCSKAPYARSNVVAGPDKKAGSVFRHFDGLVHGAPWFNGDHMVFVQNRVPAVAFRSEHMSELMRTVTHTSLDTPHIIDCHKLVELAVSLTGLIRSLPRKEEEDHGFFNLH